MASPPSVPRPARWPAWVAVAAVLAASAGAMLDLRPPAAVPATAPPTDFSAHRAHAQLAVVADRPHAAGSAAADRVREHLIARLRGLGLDTSVQDTVAPEAGQLSGGAGTVAVARVRNVVAVLPGTAPTGRVFLVAHYDSVQTGPGGNDDGAGVGAVLEVARALAAGPRPRNDTVFVLTDAEEACLCGASAFAAGHPLARDGGVVLNLEARGSTGPVVMFETSTDNAALVAAFARAAPHPVGTSFAVEVYRLLPNDTDFTAFLAAGFTGLNSAYLDGSAVYHTPLDTPAAVDLRSLQHHGDNALGLAREFGRADLAALSATGDATYFPVPGGLIRYPGWLTWPLAALTVLAVAGLAGLARRRRLLTWPRLAAAGGLALGPLVLCPVAAQALWWAVTAIRPGYAELVDPYRPVPFRLAALALAAAVLLGWYAAARRRVGGTALAIGALAWLALLGVGLAAVVPGGAYLATLPALAGAGAGALAMLPRGVPAPRALLVSAAASAGAGIVAGVVLLPAMVLLLPALGMATVGAAAFLGVLFAMVALPLLESVHPSPHAGRPRWRRAVAAAAAPATATLAAIGLAVAGLAVNGFDAAHPMPTHLMYALDTETGRAQWLSFEEEPLPWTAGYVGGRIDPGAAFPVLSAAGSPRGGPARAADLPAPELRVLADSTAGRERTVRLLLVPRRPVRLAALAVDGATAGVRRASVGGLAVTPEPSGDGRWSLNLTVHAPPPAGIEVELVLTPAPPGAARADGAAPANGAAPAGVRVRVFDGSDGLGGLPGFRPRPPDVGIAGSHTAELVVVAATRTL